MLPLLFGEAGLRGNAIQIISCEAQRAPVYPFFRNRPTSRKSCVVAYFGSDSRKILP
jgi:hypothetical protein